MRAFSGRAPKRPTVRHAALVCAGAVGLLLALNQLIPTVWYSPRIEARVVGPDGAPLANALVVANWNIMAPWTGASLGQLALAEVSTGPDGRFSIPAWGPRLTLHGSVREEDPTLRIIKPGYQPRVIHNISGGAQQPRVAGHPLPTAGTGHRAEVGRRRRRPGRDGRAARQRQCAVPSGAHAMPVGRGAPRKTARWGGSARPTRAGAFGRSSK